MSSESFLWMIRKPSWVRLSPRFYRCPNTFVVYIAIAKFWCRRLLLQHGDFFCKNLSLLTHPMFLIKFRYLSLLSSIPAKSFSFISHLISRSRHFGSVILTFGITTADMVNNIETIAKSGTEVFSFSISYSLVLWKPSALVPTFPKSVSSASFYTLPKPGWCLSKHNDDEQYILESTY